MEYKPKEPRTHCFVSTAAKTILLLQGIENVGCLIDNRSYAAKYAKAMPIPVTLGAGIVHNGKRAEFVPLQQNKQRRWTGEL